MKAFNDDMAAFSTERLTALANAFAQQPDITGFDDLTIYATGSYARGEATKRSDLDLFFLYNGNTPLKDLKTKEQALFAAVKSVCNQFQFPPFSSNGKYLKILRAADIFKCIGGKQDDYKNLFTARMLLLLESTPLHGHDVYEKIITDVSSCYFRDYYLHEKGFKPLFLINDILRFWKTLCLNYENKRNQNTKNTQDKAKEKTKNFKLKFSRATICFATIAWLIARSDANPEDISTMCAMSPLERFAASTSTCNSDQQDKATDVLNKIIEEYRWFLQELDTKQEIIYDKFGNEEYCKTTFARANRYGGHIFDLLQTCCRDNFFRYLVV